MLFGKKSHIIKDSVNVIDDYRPAVNPQHQAQIIDMIYGMYGDRAGRTRMLNNTNSDLKAPFIANGLCIITRRD